jgi:hypothetical protein
MMYGADVLDSVEAVEVSMLGTKDRLPAER